MPGLRAGLVVMAGQHKDQGFFKVVAYLLNIILAGYLIVAFADYRSAPDSPLPVQEGPSLSVDGECPLVASEAVWGGLLGAYPRRPE